MTRSDIDIKDALYGWIKGSDLAGVVSGEVYKNARPLNSDKEDIVIAVIARTASGEIQEATANVNIYVKSVKRGRDFIEDDARLRELCSLASSLFEYRQDGEAIYRLVSQEVMSFEGSGWQVINNRLSITYNNETT